jgi:hypothetical protein
MAQLNRDLRFILPFVVEHERERRALLTVADEQLFSVVRNDRSAVRKPAASSKFVFPWPFAPTRKCCRPENSSAANPTLRKMPQGEFAQAHQGKI